MGGDPEFWRVWALLITEWRRSGKRKYLVRAAYADQDLRRLVFKEIADERAVN